MKTVLPILFLNSYSVVVRCCFLIALLSFSTICKAGSIDCYGTKDSIERKICSDPTLRNVDEQYFNEYSRLAYNFSKYPQFYNLEENWRTNTRNKCDSHDCIILAYQNRLDELKQTTPETMVRRADSDPNYDTNIKTVLPSHNEQVIIEHGSTANPLNFPAHNTDGDMDRADEIMAPIAELPYPAPNIETQPRPVLKRQVINQYTSTDRPRSSPAKTPLYISILLLVGGLVLIFSVLYAFFGGLKNELIIYNDSFDLVLTILAIAIPSILFMLSQAKDYQEYHNELIAGTGALSLMFFLMLVNFSKEANDSITKGICVSIFKLLLSSFGLLYLSALIIGISSSNKKSKSTGIRELAIFMIFVTLFERMINGPAVRYERS